MNLDGRPADAEAVGRMTDVLAHRGPDDRDVYVNGPVGLGHRRLAVIDTSPAGRQPMKSSDDRFIITYNGETYNFRELRSELEKLGRRFISMSDTEVVLNALAEWGEQAIDRFNGMFAFALWDNEKKELTLARDRYGMKPLYYAMANNRFIFGSEVKAILADGNISARLDREALLEYFTFQNFFTTRTLFKEAKLLPPGTIMKVSLEKGGAIHKRKFWDFHFTEPAEADDERSYVEELGRLFKQAVTRQLVSDVEVGAYLSGGMDSGAITAVASSHFPYLKSFTVGFDLSSASGIELAFDERSKAERMSYLFKTEHYEMVLKAGDMERAMPRLAWHVEEPRVGQSYPNYYAAGLAGKFCKVALSGVGGDELFGGYPWRYYRAAINGGFEEYVDKYYLFWQRLIPNREIREVFSPIWNDVRHVWTRNIFRDVLHDGTAHLSKPEDYINRSLYFEAKTFLHGLLVVEDKLSMAHGLETRAPFLDNDLVDFAMRAPVRLKLGNLGEVMRLNENDPGPKTKRYFTETRDGKLLLRKAMEKYAPPEITNGVKRGFSAPDASWFKGESIDYVRRVIFNDNAKIYEYLNRSAVKRLVNEHLEGKMNRRLLIWSLLSFENWLDTYCS